MMMMTFLLSLFFSTGIHGHVVTIIIYMAESFLCHIMDVLNVWHGDGGECDGEGSDVEEGSST